MSYPYGDDTHTKAQGKEESHIIDECSWQGKWSVQFPRGPTDHYSYRKRSIPRFYCSSEQKL